MKTPIKPRQTPYKLAEDPIGKPTGSVVNSAKKTKVRPIMGEMGGTGTQDNFGIISDDYNSQFHTASSMPIYEKMKRTDPMIRATMEALRRPILAAGYVINPPSDDATDQEITEFIAHDLEAMETPFCQLLEEILDYPFLGFRYFEKCFKIVDGMVHWEKWASRQPSAHYRWEQSDGSKGVQQILTNTKDKRTYADIPWDKLLVFTYQKDGSNYDGFPLLRSVFRNWEAKDLLYRIQLISMERAAGVLWIKLPKGATPVDKDDAEELGENFRINEQTFIVTPQEWEIAMITNGISEKTARIEPEIEHHNRMIALNILAQFITLTSGDGGSNALSKDQSSFFTLGLRSIAKNIAYVINQAIKELVIMNWGERDRYPELHFNKIGQVDYAETASSLSTLAGAGLIEVTPEVKQSIHSMYDLPELDIEKMREEEANGEGEDMEAEDEEAADGEEPDDTGEEENPDDLMDELGDLEGMLSEVYKLASRGPMDEETKKKISEALKKHGAAQDEDKEVRGYKSGKGATPAQKEAIKAQIAKLKESITGMKTAKTKAGFGLKTRKNVLKLQKTFKKGKEKLDKLATQKASIKSSMDSMQEKFKKETNKEKKASLQAKLDAYQIRLENNTAKTSELQGQVDKLSKLDKRIGLMKMAEVEIAIELAETDDYPCEHGRYMFAEFKPFRDLTYAEKRVKFASVNTYLNKAEERIVSVLADFTKTQRDDVITAVTRAIENNDIRGLKELADKRTEALKRQLRQEAVNALEFGKSQAAGEIGVTAPSTPSVNTQILDTDIDQLVDERNVGLLGNIKNITMAGIAAGAGLATIIYNVKQAFDSSAEGYNKNLSGYLAGTALNAGRNLVFWENGQSIHAIQRSEILDSQTCAMCLTLDGRVMDIDDPFANLQEVHTNCRGINVAILKNDTDLPEASALPSYITNKFDTVEGVPITNSFTQLKNAKVVSGSRLQQKIKDGKITDNPNL